MKGQLNTLPETNIFAPKNGCLEYVRSFPIGVKRSQEVEKSPESSHPNPQPGPPKLPPNK